MNADDAPSIPTFSIGLRQNSQPASAMAQPDSTPPSTPQSPALEISVAVSTPAYLRYVELKLAGEVPSTLFFSL
jgi:hypothetical protein